MESTSKLPTLHLMTGVSNIMLFFPSQELGQINRNRHSKQVIGGHICKLTLQYKNLSSLAITKHLLWHIPTIENCSFVNFFYNIILQVKKNVLGFQSFACVLRNRLMKTFLLLYNYTYPPFFETTYYYSRGGKLPCASQFLSHPIQHSFPLLGTIRICSIRTSFSLKHFLSSLYIYISGKITNALVNCLPKNGTIGKIIAS